MEAAIVLPIVIMTIITIVLIIMYFYDCSVSQSKLHQALHYEAAAVSGKTVHYLDSGSSDTGNPDIYFEHDRKSIRASTHVSMMHRGTLWRSGQRDINGSVHLYDGAKYVLRRQKIEAFIEREQ